MRPDRALVPRREGGGLTGTTIDAPSLRLPFPALRLTAPPSLGPFLSPATAVVSDACENTAVVEVPAAVFKFVGAAACLSCAPRRLRPPSRCSPVPAPLCSPGSGSKGSDAGLLVSQQQNFKQKVVALLRRFKVSDEVSAQPRPPWQPRVQSAEGSGGQCRRVPLCCSLPPWPSGRHCLLQERG